MEHHPPIELTPKTKKVLAVFFVLCALVVLLDAFDLVGRWTGSHALEFKSHRHYDVEGWFGFYGVYGFIGCVLLVLAAKVMRVFLMRGEDYYDG